MPKTIILSEPYMQSYDKFDRQTRKIIMQSIKMFANDEKGNGFQVHDLRKSTKDKSFRSARINQDLRLIFSQQGEQNILLYVDRHDEAYKWAEGKSLNMSLFGAVYVNDENLTVQGSNSNYLDDFNDEPSLCEQQEISVKNLIKLGITQIHAELIHKIKNEEEFIQYIHVFPQEVQEALIDLITGSKNITEVIAELEDQSLEKYPSIEQGLLHKDSKRRFFIVQNLDELEGIFEQDFDLWRLFLHPKQEQLVKQNFNGPALIEGGPGTGKTVVAIHRAAYLSKHIYPASTGHRILFCTFSRKLASYIKDNLDQLILQNKLDNNVELKGVDQVLAALVHQYELTEAEVSPNEVNELLIQTYNELQPDFSLNFFKAEYADIILRYTITTLEEYLLISRQGMGAALNPAQRSKAWVFFDVFLQRKIERKIIDFEDRAALVCNAIKKGIIPPMYDSIIIDEAQDLSPIKIKALSLLTKSNRNNLFILSDQNQRIYTMANWRKDTRIDIVGRTFHLNVNYRTTKQIREYADKQFIKTTMNQEHIKGYKSLLNGPEPEVKHFNSKKLQYNYIIQLLKQYIKDLQIPPHEICIISPIDRNEFSGILLYEEIPNTVLENDLYPRSDSGVCITSLHGCKGLEFRIVILANYTEIGSDVRKLDPGDWYTDIKVSQTECLKYVASTRSREELIVTYCD
ncbi:UvrD-helicase domain-containing protein [Paenibacillus roseipurpureus]|uniref:UvrD-helicase domain-containing protein n=1 Tax=Paenibacillus roseopurpureus TaxID=2918901 RepID=A0AA96RJ94_9BACL|nr:UvrD-helicase domain-containing protein [Paenibacillus sp. MBLB1832]WNR45138.1 UvrD-helicase domain-containing protein [Paenibacillus sp. MBLB1832]